MDKIRAENIFYDLRWYKYPDDCHRKWELN